MNASPPTVHSGRMRFSPQIAPADLPALVAEGYRVIINNRPDGEAPGQPTSAQMKDAADKAGLAYAHIPVGRDGLSMDHIAAVKEAFAKAGDGKAFAFCASGTRSAILYAYAAASDGRDSAEILAETAACGYNLSAHGPALDSLRQDAPGAATKDQ